MNPLEGQTSTVRGWLIAASVFALAFLVWTVLAASITPLMLLFTAVLFTAGMRPFIESMSKRMPFGVAVGIAFGAFMVIVAALAFALQFRVGAEFGNLLKAAPSYASSLRDQLTAAQRSVETDAVGRRIADLLASGAGAAVNAIGHRLLGGPGFVASTIGNALLIVLLAVGWMLSADDLERFVLSLMPERARTDWHAAFVDIGTRLTAYVQGVVLNGAIVGAAMAAALALLGAPYPVLLGFIAALFQAIPMIGAVISGPIILLVVLATAGWTKMLIVLAIFAVVQVIDQNVLSPIIFGQRVQLSFLLIILSTIVGGTLLGIGGAFLAVPAAAVLQVIVVRIVAPAIRRANG
jgi:predicted PurR-regulated permease PerM